MNKKFARFLMFTMLLSCLLLLCGCEPEEMGSLKDVTRPYAGFYRCEKLMLGDRDYTDRFEDITLELGQGGDFELTYTTAEGNEGGYSGTYSLDTERGEITFSGKQGMRTVSGTFPYTEGKILIDRNLFGTLLHAEFCMP